MEKLLGKVAVRWARRLKSLNYSIAKTKNTTKLKKLYSEKSELQSKLAAKIRTTGKKHLGDMSKYITDDIVGSKVGPMEKMKRLHKEITKVKAGKVIKKPISQVNINRMNKQVVMANAEMREYAPHLGEMEQFKWDNQFPVETNMKRGYDFLEELAEFKRNIEKYKLQMQNLSRSYTGFKESFDKSGRNGKKIGDVLKPVNGKRLQRAPIARPDGKTGKMISTTLDNGEWFAAQQRKYKAGNPNDLLMLKHMPLELRDDFQLKQMGYKRVGKEIKQVRVVKNIKPIKWKTGN